jgi:hypothetical protein
MSLLLANIYRNYELLTGDNLCLPLRGIAKKGVYGKMKKMEEWKLLTINASSVGKNNKKSTNIIRRRKMKKLITICLVCILTTVASGNVINVIIDFNENGVGHIDGTTPLAWGMGIPPQASPNDQYATLYYELPSSVVEGDLVLYESEFDTSDVLRFVNFYTPGTELKGRVYVYSDLPETGELPELADTGIPHDNLILSAGIQEEGTENGWNGIVYTPSYIPQAMLYMPGYMMQYGENGVTYNFTSDIPEPATICLLSLGALSLIRRKK